MDTSRTNGQRDARKGGDQYLSVEHAKKFTGSSSINFDGPSDTRSRSGSHASHASHASHGSHVSRASGSHQGASPGGSPGHSRSGSQSGRSRAGSSAAKPGTSPFGPGLGYDPAIDPLKPKEGISTRLDLPPEAYVQSKMMTPFARRPGFNSTGKPVNVQVNQFRVTKIGAGDIYQYDLTVSPNPPKPWMIKRLWETPRFQTALKSFPKSWIFDERKLVWSTNNTQELRVTCNLDEAQGRPANERNTFYLILRNSGTVRLSALRSYLDGKMDWDNSVLECMTFLDHVLRQGPSIKMRAIRRNFFPFNARRQDLSNVTEVIKGMYASIRMCQSIQQGGTGLGVNVNVANTAFWLSQDFEQLVREFIGAYDKQWANMQYDRLAQELRPVETRDRAGNKVFGMSEAFKVLRKLMRIKFNVSHRGKDDTNKDYSLRRFAFDQRYGPDGGNAKNVTFELRQNGGTTRTISVFDYFQERYNIRLIHWKLPIIETTRDGLFPMELCTIPRYNRFPHKLDSSQTQQMIKFAVQRPPQSRQDIMANVAALDWNRDRYLNEFNIKIEPEMAKVQAKLIQNPEVGYSNGKVNPGISGRWDLRGKKFVLPNAVPLKSWAFVACEECIDEPTLQNFVKVFTQVYQGHGGRIEGKPKTWIMRKGMPHDQMVSTAYNETGKANKMTPQIIFYILRDRTSWVYERMKKNADCRWACLTQMMLAEHVRRAQPQYCSNVCMKVNSKLGGQTSRIPSVGAASAFFKAPTMIIGVDVSHAAPGSALASMAAMSMSMDKDAATYAGACETNGHRVEILTPVNIRSMMPDMLKLWVQKNKTYPEHLFYFRDGVGEGQFAHVMQFEIDEIKRAFNEVIHKVPKITVIVATKRHNIRFFPEKGDKNGNALPGTLVEREVTHPFHYDFYLCSHVAIQGTARPVHYHVLHDEIGMKPDDLQKMIYQQCYQYARSTTPVSLHPAVYYAHLISNRARSHENAATSDQVPTYAKDFVMGKAPGPMAKSEATSRQPTTESIPLLPMGGPEAREDAKAAFRSTMWYI